VADKYEAGRAVETSPAVKNRATPGTAPLDAPPWAANPETSVAGTT